MLDEEKEVDEFEVGGKALEPDRVGSDVVDDTEELGGFVSWDEVANGAIVAAAVVLDAVKVGDVNDPIGEVEDGVSDCND